MTSDTALPASGCSGPYQPQLLKTCRLKDQSFFSCKNWMHFCHQDGNVPSNAQAHPVPTLMVVVVLSLFLEEYKMYFLSLHVFIACCQKSPGKAQHHLYKGTKSHVLHSWKTTKCQRKQKKNKIWIVCFFFLRIQSSGQCYMTILQMRTLKYSFGCSKCVSLNIDDLCGEFCQISATSVIVLKSTGLPLNKS